MSESEEPLSTPEAAQPREPETDPVGCWKLVGVGALTGIFVITFFLIVPLMCSERMARTAPSIAAQVLLQPKEGCVVESVRINGEIKITSAGKRISVPSLREALVEVRVSGESVRRKVKLSPGEVNLEVGCKPASLTFRD